MHGLSSLTRVCDLKLTLPESGCIPLALSFAHFRDLRSICIAIPATIPEWGHTLDRIIRPLSEVIGKYPALKHLEVVRQRAYEYPEYEDVDPVDLNDNAQACFPHLIGRVDPQLPLQLKDVTLVNDVVHMDAHIRAHLRCLEKLHMDIPSNGVIYPDDDDEDAVRRYAPSSRIAAMWRDLAAAEIFPPAFCTPAPTDAHALQYLAAHPGLARLELTDIERLYDPRYFDMHADTFYADVLPRHGATLTHLFIDAGRHGAWALSRRNAGVILQCRALVELKMALNFEYHIRREVEGEPEPIRFDDTVRVFCILYSSVHSKASPISGIAAAPRCRA